MDLNPEVKVIVYREGEMPAALKPKPEQTIAPEQAAAESDAVHTEEAEEKSVEE